MLDYEEKGRVAILRINRPEARNAVNGAVAQGIESGIDRLEENDDVWIGILTHEGPVFSAGADLKVVSTDPGQMATEKGGFGGIVTRERTKPIIAAMNGPALAGGCEIALSCDMLVASTEVTFGVPEVKRNLVAAAGALYRLPRVLPWNLAMELALTGEPLDATRAYDLGMVNRLAEPGCALETAMDLADAINANGPLSVRATRQAMIDGFTMSTAAEGIDVAGAAFARMMATEDFSEGITAFIEKRDPEWKAR